MTATADTGNLAEASLSSSTLGAAVRRIGAWSESVGVIEDSDLSTTGRKTKIFEALADSDGVEIEVEKDINTEVDITAAVETLTIKFPIEPGSGNTTKAQIAGTGKITSVTHGELANGVLMVDTVVFTWNGKTGPTWTDEAV